MRISAFNRRQALMGTTTSGLVATLGLSNVARAADTSAPEKPPVPELAVFAKSPHIEHIALSPDSNYIAFVTSTATNKILSVNTISDSKFVFYTRFPQTKIRDLSFIDNDHVLIVYSQTSYLKEFAGNKHEFYLAQVINIKTKKSFNLFKSIDDFYNIIDGAVYKIKTGDTYRLAASSPKIDNVFNRFLYSFGLDGESPRKLIEGSNDTEGFIINPDGRVMAYSDYNDERKVWTLFYNIDESGKYPKMHKTFEVKKTNSPPDLLGIGRDGNCVVVAMSADNDKNEYFEIGADGVPRAIPDPNRTSAERGVLFHPQTWCMCGFSRHGDTNIHDYFDPLLKKIDEGVKASMGDDYRSYIVEFANDPRKMIVHGEGQGDAGTYYVLDLSKGDIIPVSENYPDLPKPWITQKKAIDYKAADGLNIHAYLSLPSFKDAKNLPLVVMPHGGPQARDTLDLDWEVQALNARGYAVLQPNYRGSSGYGEAFIEAGHGEFGRKMQTDLSDGVRHLVKQGLVGPKRVAIYGASYGGYAALAGATLDPGVYRCAVDVAGISHLKHFLNFIADNHDNTDSAVVHYWKKFFGDPKSYDDISPAKQAAKADCPILIIHGEDDTVVPIEQSREMERALKSAGKPVELITYKGQDHWETIESARIDMIKRVVSFIETHNPA